MFDVPNLTVSEYFKILVFNSDDLGLIFENTRFCLPAKERWLRLLRQYENQ
jgi:hypothetical protein